MDSAETNPSCNYCCPIVSRKDPYENDKPRWDSQKIECVNKKPVVECQPGCRHFETCAPGECASYYSHGTSETPACLGIPPGSFPPRPIPSAVMPVYMKPALYCERGCSRVHYKALPSMKPMCNGQPPVSAAWPILDAADAHFRGRDKDVPWKYCTKIQLPDRIFSADCVEKKVPAVCPFDDPANDCYLSGDFVVNTFSKPPCYGGGGFGPCEELHPQESHRSTWTGACVYEK